VSRVASEPELFLASTSPRRRTLLAERGIPFRLIDPGPEEPGPEEPGPGEPAAPESSPEQEARARARRKALLADPGVRAGLVLAADTIVALDGRCLQKPGDRAEARWMLWALSGREHRVVTAIALVLRPAGTLVEAADTARVVFRDLPADEVERYLDLGEWQDKAGGYAVQGRGAALVARIEGPVDTVIGLPVDLVLAARSRLLAGEPAEPP
jgi:septum formation protein